MQATPAWGQETGNAAPATREITDETGRRIRVATEIRRIISLAPNLTETVYALGVQERLVGVTNYCDYPLDALNKTKVGGAINPSLEQIVALKPDLVLATRALNRSETVEAVERLGLAIYGTEDPRTVEDVLRSILRVAEVLDAREQGAVLVAQLRLRLESLALRLARRKPRRVLFIVWHEPLITVGRDTFLADALRLAGAELALDLPQEWPRASLEEVVRVQPEYLVFATSHSEQVLQTLDDLRARPGWRSLDAVQEGRMATISDAVNRPGPRLVEAIEELARQLHPEAFEQDQENRKEKMEKRQASRHVPSFLSSIFYFPSAAKERGR